MQLKNCSDTERYGDESEHIDAMQRTTLRCNMSKLTMMM